MAKTPPPIDPRTAADIARQVRRLLPGYAPGWPVDGETGEAATDPLTSALIAVFARYGEIIIERLNRVPEKNFLAFLDLLGASPLPPRPARVPLSFSLAPGSTVDAVVPAATQVAAPPAEGEKVPVIFETERELVVSAAQLTALFTRDPARDRYTEHAPLLNPQAAVASPVFQGDRPLDHLFYLGHDTLFGYSALQRLSLHFVLEEEIADPDPRTLAWEIWDGKEGIPLTPDSAAGGDGTQSLTRSGQVVFTGLSPFPRQSVDAVTGRWLRCRLETPITQESAPRNGMVRAAQLPKIETITLRAALNGQGLEPEQGLTNLLHLDLSKDFFPFGEKPRFGDIFYFAQAAAFALGGATITLGVTLINPASGETQTPPPVKPSEDLLLGWECWDGEKWAPLGVSTPKGPVTPAPKGFADTTLALSQSGQVRFVLPVARASSTIAGVAGFWVRARIVTGNYGDEARYVPVEPGNEEKGYKYIPATFAPPVVGGLAVAYSLTRTAAPEDVKVYNDFAFAPLASPLVPFQPTEQADPSFHLGFDLPSGLKTFPNRTLSLYARLAQVVYGQAADGPAPEEPPRLAWQYWNGSAWSALKVLDDTENLTRSGLLEFLAPADLARRRDFGRERYWVRALWGEGGYRYWPKLEKLLANTTLAAQGVTVANEILGSGSGGKGQTFRAARAPVLEGAQLVVREPEIPAAEERGRIEKEEGAGAVRETVAGRDGSREIWVRWHQVSDFHASGPRDRHYLLDHLSGEVRFGDGQNGMIPPRGTGNIRLARYRTGGGTRGNKGAGALVQLKTTVPYVEKVVNRVAAAGGAEAEESAHFLERAPRALRHRQRAVTLEDYEDLVRLASTEVARSRCVPLYDLAQDPDAALIRPGTVSVVIVPRTAERKPLPSQELIDAVETYLDRHKIPTAEAVVVGPEYVRVEVEAEIALVSPEGAGAVATALSTALDRFLHPLTGGAEGLGWDFGRKPHRSDLYALIEGAPGVDHVRVLKVSEIEERPGALATGRFLVYPGQHVLRLILPDN